jgi:hypothetical protein
MFPMLFPVLDCVFSHGVYNAAAVHKLSTDQSKSGYASRLSSDSRGRIRSLSGVMLIREEIFSYKLFLSRQYSVAH